MNKLFYPAVFHRAEEGGFWVSFPDFPECLTEGDDMTQAYEMAVEALGLALVSRKKEKEELPIPSEMDRIIVDDGVLVVIEFDMLEYQKKHNSKAVKKTLSIPEWMNEEAVARGVNFSQVLQEALMSKLNIGFMDESLM
ncbi:MAG TPA: type II toxin-antitoxin system HicB family antitoxin [Candidatus Dorea merdavium]|nr:type II toxin-antitoxin system HicB family antitoxin [Candidatus Dorea merdavium]